MNNSVKNIISNTNVVKDKYKILTFPTHERYETQLCKTGHDFYSFSINGQKTWNFEQLPPPKNYYILQESTLPAYINFDFILIQSKFWQFQVAQKIVAALQIPTIVLEHTAPLTQDAANAFSRMLGDINVFITKYSLESHDIKHNCKVINHGIDTEVFKPQDCQKQPHVLTVANDFKNRDYALNYSGWSRVTDGLNVKVVGDNNDTWERASSTEELALEYNMASVYFNSTTKSPIPMSLLEAMACGCAIVTTATCEIPNIIQNGINGFISNDENELKSYISKLLSDNELRKELGENARKTILEKFSEKAFIENWNKTFNEVMEVV